MSDEQNEHPILRIRAIEVGEHAGRVRYNDRTSRLPCGFMMLFDRRTNKPLTLANTFLLEEGVRGKSNRDLWEKTEKSYCDDLANWGAYLSYRGKTFGEATWGDIVDYRDVLTNEISSNTLQRFDDSTIRRRVGTVVSMYEFGFNRGYVNRVVPERSKRIFARSGIPLTTTQAVPDPVNRILPPKPKQGEKIRLVPRPALLSALDWLGPEVTSRQPGGRSSRDRTAVESALATGGRVDEIASINVFEVLELERRIDENDPRQVLTVQAWRSKGKSSRSLFVPQRMARKWLAYAKGERAEVCRGLIERFGSDMVVSDKLFLNHASANKRDCGQAASADTLSRSLSKAFLATGHVIRQSRAVLDANGYPILDERGRLAAETFLVSANTIHDLRHTFVVLMYHAMKRAGHKNPWKQISRALGHATIDVTIDTYGNHVEISESGLMDAMDAKLYELDSWAGTFSRW